MEIKRIPIRAPRLTWEEVYDEYVKLIHYASHNTLGQYRNWPAVSSGRISEEDLFQEGQLLLYKCWERYNKKTVEEFGYVFKASLWRHLRDVCGKKEIYTCDISEAYELGYDQEVEEQMFEQFQLQQIAELLKGHPIALTILKEFLNPSKRTVWECKMDMARKRMLANQGKIGAAPKIMSINKHHIKRGMEISTVRFNQEYNLVKKAVKEVYACDPEELCG